jgi:hypothetical protein
LAQAGASGTNRKPRKTRFDAALRSPGDSGKGYSQLQRTDARKAEIIKKGMKFPKGESVARKFTLVLTEPPEKGG